MNILASLQWLKEFVATDATPEEIAAEVSLRALSVDTWERVGEGMEGVVVGMVDALAAHPNADRLRVVQVNIGEYVASIVCGGKNLAVEMRVAVALPGARVRWHGAQEWSVLEPAEIRGVGSAGMICAPAELGFDLVPCGDQEIWDISALTDAPAGTALSNALHLEDVMFDAEVTTNRPDCKAMEGFAREVAMALRAPFTARAVPEIVPGKEPLSVTVEDGRRCPRYCAVRMTGVHNGQSPWWMQQRLLRAGARSISAVVDITNYVRLELGQPLHAFDATKLVGEIVVRAAHAGEEMHALDEKAYTLGRTHLVIADGEGPVAIAGVMGGTRTMADSATTEVIIEAATFDSVSVRRTARDLNCTSDSQLLFEKGLSPELAPRALARAVELFQEICGATVASVVADVAAAPIHPQTFTLSPKVVCARIGVEIPDEEMHDILTRLGFGVVPKGRGFTVTVPSWRDHDITGEIDLTEEIARSYGYHRMPRTLPSGKLPGRADDTQVVWEAWVKRWWTESGFTEFFSTSFVDERDLTRYGLSATDAVEIANPLADDARHLRTSLIPGILRDIARNEATTPQASVFECSRIYLAQPDDLPKELLRLAVAEFGATDTVAAFRRLKGALIAFGDAVGCRFSLEEHPGDARWQMARAATIRWTSPDGAHKTVGALGEVAHNVHDRFGIMRPVLLLDLDLHTLLPFLRQSPAYHPVPAFPVVTRDIAIMVGTDARFAAFADAARKASPLVRDVDFVEQYRGAGIPDGQQSMTLSLTFGAADRTLTSEEVDAAAASITRSWGILGATVRD